MCAFSPFQTGGGGTARSPDGAVIFPCVGRICQTFAHYLQHKNILFPPQTHTNTPSIRHLRVHDSLSDLSETESDPDTLCVVHGWAACLCCLRSSSLPALSRLFHALHPPPLIASCSALGLSSAPSSAPRPRPWIGAVRPLGAQLPIIADLTPNSQLAPARRSVLIIYRLPQHLQ